MSPRNFLIRAIEPGLLLVPGYMVSDAARVLLMAIAGQESNWAARAQVMATGLPAALGYWQFQNDGVAGVMQAASTQAVMVSICATLDVPTTSVWTAVQYNDALACAVARLCLWADPAPLPAWGDAVGAYNYYVANWKPGRPDQTRWAGAYATAVATVGAGHD